jgi:hypothetical protein
MRGIGDTRSDVHDSCDLELSPYGSLFGVFC